MRILRLALAVAGAAALLSGADGDFMNCPSEPGKTIWALPVRVLTQEWMPVDGLSAADFTVKVNGTPQRVCGFNHMRWPISLGIVVDNSGSMRGTPNGPFPYSPQFSFTTFGTDLALSLAGPQDEHFLESLGDNAAVKVPLTPDGRAVRRALDGNAVGRTAFVDGLYLAMQHLAQARHWDRGLLVLSDGDDNASIYQWADLATLAAASPSAPILLLSPAHPRTRDLTGVLATPELQKLILQSGGFFAVEGTFRGVQAAIGGFTSALRSPYVLYFGGPAPANRKSLKVELKKVRPHPQLSFGTPTACASPGGPPCDFDPLSSFGN